MSQETEGIRPEEQQIPYTALNSQQKKQRLRELAVVFLKLGTIAFGGPAAHIAMMDDEVAKRRQWMSREKLLDLLGVTNLIPGPNSTELAIHIGYERAGWRGLIIAGTCFILPAMSIVWVLAIAYKQYQTLPQAEGLLYGIKPVIIAIVLQALWKLGQKAIKDVPTGIVAVAVIVAFFFGWDEIVLLLLAGLSVMLVKSLGRSRGNAAAWLLPLSLPLAQAGHTTPTPPVGWLNVFLFFLKIGSVLYGSGYVLLAFLQRDLVERNQWLTSQQLLDAVAIGQFTPGPVFTTATFIGYLLAGHAGAIAATIGIFLPAFVLVGIINPWVPKLRQSTLVGGFLDGVNAASLGLMAVVSYTLGRTALIDIVTVVLAIVSAIAVFRFKINSAWLVLAGGIIGLILQLVR
ncbi:chromate transporter [Chroococcidiopsis cubana SAG 39.79]|jgi:chromate transporter|uniref:Chromate transporter n=1 Tax=Chroococcidiopsis cubana SAG 39.79 TaxID=388085 RepID=A0AB37UP91_9CYAN|nr:MULTISPECIES: chromate transporter [Chroococcidiopsis]PSB41862.1 chromate transporter [Cyanosarcina cf. burmensis CCALA 770]RUT13184.1 chromate transporter [Chroococcidiopsis cubana SAG 39.79]URD50271.1 chromate transporter [Chroococcidiopsis sp. CCNUC1]